MPIIEVEIFRGRQLAAARALVGMTVRELADLSGVNKATISDLEGRDLIEITARRRHGYVARSTWAKIIGALSAKDVELFHPSADRGAGVAFRRADQ